MIEFRAGYEHRTPDVITWVAIPVARPSEALAVIEIVIRVQGLITEVIIRTTMERAAAVAGYCGNGSSRGTAVLRLVVSKEDLNFGDRIHIGLVIGAGAAAGVHH